MSAFLGNLAFLNPWALAGLLALPALWFLLRVMPPAPKIISLPSLRFLNGLIPKEQTPSKTPWWILLLRLMIMGFVIIAFARPVLNPSDSVSGASDIRLMIDNGWSAAHLWDSKMEMAQDILAQAKRSNRTVSILTSAPIAGVNISKPSSNPMSAAEASSILKALTPLPWPSNYDVLAKSAKENSVQNIDTFWLSDGVDGAGLKALSDTFLDQGTLKVFEPRAEDLPVALRFSKTQSGAFSIVAPDALPSGMTLTLQALDGDGRVIGLQSVALGEDLDLRAVAFDIPEVLRAEMRQIRIAERSGAGGTLILGDRFARKSVGIVSPVQDAQSKPFIEASYYLTRALEPFANVTIGSIEDILAQNVSMMVLPDIGAMSPLNLNRLEAWVKGGGLLLRFAGPSMSDTSGASGASHFLLPTPLRINNRSLGGALSWDSPPKLSEFPENSPLYGLEISEDITIKQQILAEPAEDLPQKTWAQLEDGTPLITASALEQGMLVMVHITASPDWSDLPLSGVFVHMMQRFVRLAGTAAQSAPIQSGALQPIWVMDGFGRKSEPDSNAQALSAAALQDATVSAAHPPGLYGRGANVEALNLGAQIEQLSALPNLSATAQRQFYGQVHERDLMTPLLFLALILLLVDWVIALALSFNFRIKAFRSVVMMVLLGIGVITTAPNAKAQATATATGSDLKYSSGFYLAYIETSDSSLNAATQRGLEGLSAALTRRTSAEPAGVVALDPARDTLSFFPLIYWPVSTRDPALSEAALANIQSYLDHGGTILFDTRTPNAAANSLNASGNGEALQRMIGPLNIPALAPIPKDHVLGRSFYLLDTFPGRYQGGTLWTETTSANGRDGVSSVIIGSHDWAGAWAQSLGRDYRSGNDGGSRQREMAMRFGVNVVMYALTGNYKADQVHVTNILERLGK